MCELEPFTGSQIFLPSILLLILYSRSHITAVAVGYYPDVRGCLSWHSLQAEAPISSFASVSMIGRVLLVLVELMSLPRKETEAVQIVSFV